MTARGTPNAQNTQMLNGVNVNDPAAQGFSMIYYTPTHVREHPGLDRRAGHLGRHGRHLHQHGHQERHEPAERAWRSADLPGRERRSGTTSTTTLKDAGFRPEAAAVDFITNTNGQVGGPLKKNKLFYFGSGNYQSTHVNVPGFPAVTPLPVLLGDTSQQDTTDITAGNVKLNYQANASNRFEGYLERQQYDKPNRGAAPRHAGLGDTKSSTSSTSRRLRGTRVLTDRMFVDTKLSYNNTHFPL